MNQRLKDDLADVVYATELSTGMSVNPNVVFNTLVYSIRKLSVIGKDMDYLPLLFESELKDHVIRSDINIKGGTSYVCSLFTDSMQHQMPQCS